MPYSNLRHRVSTKEPEANIATLNPWFLQAVRDEAANRQKAGLASLPTMEPDSATALHPAAITASHAAVQQVEPWEPDVVIDQPGMDRRQEPATALVATKAAVAEKQAEIARLQQQLDRLNKIRGFIEAPASGLPDLNALRMKRLAIQMALVADSQQYDEDDLRAVDREIVELNRINPGHYPLENPAIAAGRSNLSADIEAVQTQMRGLRDDIEQILASHNLRVACAKAEDYLNALTAANLIRHELLALAELLPGEDGLMNMRLGGELPVPSGLEPFDRVIPETLATTLDGIEEAKNLIRLELLL